MPVQDALKTLGLKPTATPDEIRQAYRDLVKVWHPDRFGTDARLRAKAEEHLKAINSAFHTLESSGFRIDLQEEPQQAPAEQPQATPRPRASRERILRGWLYVASLLLIAAMAGYVVHALADRQEAAISPAIQQPSPSAASAERAPAKPSHKASHATDLAPSGKPDFQVWSLSQADTDRVQLACASHTPGSEQYRRCMKAQLDALRQSRGAPDLAGLNTGEREAAENACAGADGASGYNHCLRQQVAALAAEPIRPDLSTFNAADRASIQAACSAQGKRGVAEYDRCLVRFARTLSEAQPPLVAR
ncbi:MAG TPA: J domain-containing protein [Acidobacteriaceae bacterium]|nr:J domain-containing protein [Acidobacteriaceae bacterium]